MTAVDPVPPATDIDDDAVVADLGQLGDAGLGTIGPANPADRLTGRPPLRRLRPNARVDGRPGWVVADCVDGRPLAPGWSDPAAARTAGGTLTLLAGLWALDDGFADLNPAGMARACLANHLPVWAHDGCGTNQRLGDIAAYLTVQRRQLDVLRRRLGLPAAPPARPQEAARLTARLAASSPAARLAGWAEAGLTLPEFAGDHAEVGLIVNLATGLSVDRAALARATGSAQAFALDAWALPDSAAAALAAVGAKPDRRDQLADIMLDLALATVGVLGRPDLELMVIRARPSA